jgi:hypothetical protein
MKRTTNTKQNQGYCISRLVGTCDLRTLWSPPVSLNQERHTQRRKAATFIFIFYFFVKKIRWKVPHENIYGEANILENFPKKNEIVTFPGGEKKEFWNRHILRRKKRVLKSPHFEEKKTGFEITEICGGFGQIPSFLILKRVYEGRANPNPLTPKEDDRTDRHLKYYIYWVPVTFEHSKAPRFL